MRWTPARGVEWLVLASLALAVRLLHLWQIHDAPVFDHLVVDGAAYDAWAREIAAGRWMGTEVFYQAPLYPYFLASIYAVVGHDLGAVRVVQAVLGAVGCVLLDVAGTRLFDRRVGLLAGVMLAVWPSAVFADGLIQKSALDTFLVCGLLAAVALAVGSPRPARWMVAGLVLGALALTRENMLVLAPVLLVFLALGGGPRRAVAAAWFCAGLALCLAPVAVRNWAVGGELHLTTSQFGPNFFIGNNDRATGGYRPLLYDRGDPRFERRDATELAERALARPLGPGEVSAYWMGRALEFIRREPARWLRLTAHKAVLFVNRIELGDAEDQYTYGDWSTWLTLTTPVLSFGVLIPLAMAGIVLAWDRRPARLLAVLLGVYAVTVIGTYVMARYRHPMLPLLVLFAAVAILEIGRASRPRRWIALVLATAIALPANWPTVAQSKVRSGSLYNIARVLEDEPGGLVPAEDYYRRALAADPSYALAHSNLGTVLERRGRLDEARASFERAMTLEPDRPEFAYNLAHVEAARGDEVAAVALYERALALDPTNPDAHTNLGVLLQQRGDLEGALRQYDAALAANPRHVGALTDRGIAFAQLGRFEDAIASFRAAVAVDPADRSARESLAIALAQAGKGAEAAAELEGLVARMPDDAELHRRLAAVLGSLGRIDDAISQLETAARLDPESFEAAVMLAGAYAHAGRFDAAVGAAERATALAERRGNQAEIGKLRGRLAEYRDAARSVGRQE